MAVRLLAVSVALFTAAAAAQAQTSVKLVSNTGETAATTLASVSYAQAFTTGSNSAGYVLTRVDYKFKRSGVTPITLENTTVAIRQNSSGTPGTPVATLTDPASLPSDGLAQFTAPHGGINLAASTTYFALFLTSGLSTDQLHKTSSDAEDTGAATGWSIADSHLWSSNPIPTWTDDTTDTDSMMIAIHGYAAEPKLASNIRQGSSGIATFNTDFAQAFTTGSHSSGYRLTGVDVWGLSDATSPPTYSVSIRSDSSGSPGARVGTLTNPASLPPTTNSTVTYSAPEGGIALKANTTYFLVTDVSSGDTDTLFRTTASDAEDSNSESGWSIADTSLWRLYSSTGDWATNTRSLKIVIDGHKAPPMVGPTITITGGSAVTEGTPAVFTVTANPAPTAELPVNLNVSESFNTSFVLATDEGAKMVAIAANGTTATYSVATQNDSFAGPNGTIRVSVSAGAGYRVGGANTAIVTVMDNDVPQPGGPVGPPPPPSRGGGAPPPAAPVLLPWCPPPPLYTPLVLPPADGSTIAFYSGRSGHQDIWTVPADGSAPPAQLTSASM
ncbi:MAG: hypothetical protein F4210_13150, partial [Holophagales bacterium]|nr:hypothetical protein [Holophagales bacterium]